MLEPSRAVELISSTPLIPRTAASTRWVTWVSSSDGAAPGWTTVTAAAGKLMSGLLLTSMRRKLTSPIRLSAANSTSGKTGLRIAQLEMLRMSVSISVRGFVSARRPPVAAGSSRLR